MATPGALDSLRKTKEAVDGITRCLKPVLEKLQDDNLDEATAAHGKATIALSIGMMSYMGARLRGLDQGRKPDDPLRKRLNNMRRVLAAVQQKKKKEEKKAPDEEEKSVIADRRDAASNTKTSDTERANKKHKSATLGHKVAEPVDSTEDKSKSGTKRQSPGSKGERKKKKRKTKRD